MTHNERKQWIMKKIDEARKTKKEERKTFIYEELQATLEDEYQRWRDSDLIRLLEKALDELDN